VTLWPPPRLIMPMREPGFPGDDAKEAVEILTMLTWLRDADVMVGSEMADDALTDAAQSAVWRQSAQFPSVPISYPS
jgi:hypothetical protein